MEDAPYLSSRTGPVVCGLVLLALFAVGVPALFRPILTTSPSPLTVRVVNFAGTKPGLVAANQYYAVTGLEVNYSGIIYSTVVNPGCATEPHRCDLPEVEFSYLVSGSSAYRLIPSSGPFIFADGTRVIVTGVLVTPSSFASTLLEGYAFAGDIYVRSIRAT